MFLNTVFAHRISSKRRNWPRIPCLNNLLPLNYRRGSLESSSCISTDFIVSRHIVIKLNSDLAKLYNSFLRFANFDKAIICYERCHNHYYSFDMGMAGTVCQIWEPLYLGPPTYLIPYGLIYLWLDL